MADKLSFVLKVVLLSAGLALAIKYWAPQFNIPATSANAIVAVVLPSLVLAGALVWRLQNPGVQKT